MKEGAIGLPPDMAGKREELTPMLSQYADLCATYDEALVLFQVGDFYEAFCEAAEAISRELEITLTKREDSTGTYPMAGIPVDSAASYIERLLQAGYRVAIADQVQEPAEASGPVDRAVTRVVTPGTVIDDELLDPGSSNYVACLASAVEECNGDAADTGADGGHGQVPSARGSDPETYAVAFADVSAGEFLVTSGPRDTVADELERFDPAEVLVAPDVGENEFDLQGMVTSPGNRSFEYERAAARISESGGSPEDFERSCETRACGALLAYVEYTQGTLDRDDEGEADGADGREDGENATAGQGRFGTLTRYEPSEHLRLDGTALRSLEVFSNRDGGDEHTLFSVLDESSSALGRRRLAGWLRRPLLDVETIEARHDAVSELASESLCREELRELLRDVYDLSRLLTRVSRERANARDLRSLRDTLDVVPEVRETLAGCETERLVALRESLDECGDVRGLIERAIRPEPPIEITDGGLIEPDFDEGLRSLRETEQSGKEWVADLEARERKRTGIDSLSVGFNQVHGYYIEITKANLDDVPDEYTRRQTLKNAERFYTPDLKRREDEIVSAGERADEREHELFREVRARVGAEADRIDRVADALADLDALCTLAAVAAERDYVRPEVGSADLVIRGGRHPVVENVQESFVPNDVSLHAGEVVILTGPNMSGKSTYMRQVALCTLLCQIGSFVPAREARLPVVDRIFTRVGASDDIAGGQSTFMREMTELATVLREASDRSLVILDEVGRGTSTVDGQAIARAATERLHDAVGARTLFATHYHELTDLADELERVTNYHFAVDGEPDSPSSSGTSSPPADCEGKRENDTDGEREGITFLHSVADGPSSASYGIDVARLAGVPDPVVTRSRDLVAHVDDDGPPHEPSTESEIETADPTANGRRTRGGDSEGKRGGPIDEVGAITGETTIPVRSGATHEPLGENETTGATGRESNGRGGPRNRGAESETIEAVLRALDIANTTPVEALCTLNELKGRLDESNERHGTD